MIIIILLLIIIIKIIMNKYNNILEQINFNYRTNNNIFKIQKCKLLK